MTRKMSQPPRWSNIHPVTRGGLWLTLAIALVAGFEGFASKPYVDRVGTGQPETWCYGATKADGPPPPYSKVFTKAQCQTLLGASLLKYDAQVHSCVKVSLPPHREAALVSFAYNLGSRALCRGAVARRINAGDIAGGCRAMLSYNHARGRILPGLTRRRQAEYKLCLRND